MCGCPVSGYQASYRESESEHVFATGHASSVAGSRVRSDASHDRVDADRTPTARVRRRVRTDKSRSAAESRRADQRFAPLHRPARVLIRIRFAFWLRRPGQPRARSAIVPSRAGN